MVEKLISSRDTPSVCLFNENPNRLVSLLDMLRVYAGNFIAVGVILERCAAGYNTVKFPLEVMDSKTAGDFGEGIARIEKDVTSMGLSGTTDIVAYHKQQGLAGGMSYQDASRASNEISRIYHSELRKRVFLYVQHERARFFESSDLLDNRTATAFPTCVLEAKDAGNCYALEQDTASVMHSMRVLEVGLSAFAKALGVDPSREQWHRIISDIEDSVAAIGPNAGADWRELKEFYAGACKEFRYFKDAWRNHAMHSRERYNGPEAKRVLDHVIDFMNHLSEHVCE